MSPLLDLDARFIRELRRHPPERLRAFREGAKQIELGQCRAGMVVSCETAREINENVIDRMVGTNDLDLFRSSVATLTGGSGAVAVLVTDKDVSAEQRRRLVGGVTKNAPQHHNLCRWGLQSVVPAPLGRLLDADVTGAVQRYLGANAGAIASATLPYTESSTGTSAIA